MRETITQGTSSKVLDFIYDESGRPFAMIYTSGEEAPVTYYYVLNLQGDVVGMIDESGEWVAEYTYNAWGEILSSSGDMAGTNPLRYRGYYYDSETGFYYLQSRYYDPVTHRFINADAADNAIYAAAMVSEANLFAYCANNPVVRTDPTGDSWWGWIAAVAVVVVLAVATVVTCGGAAAAAGAVAAVASGVAASSTAATVAAGAFIGASTALAVTTVAAASESDSIEDFADYGTTALVSTVVGAAVGGINSYSMSHRQNQQPKCSTKDSPDGSSYPEISTGRTDPRNLNEQLSMESAKSNPCAGEVIIPTLGDPRLPGYSKYQQVFMTSTGKITIHYVGNLITNHFTDFKFVYPE